jgi:hypothetical protein
LTTSEQETLGDDIVALEAGLYEVQIPGPDVITHGPDPRVRLDTRESPGGVGFEPGDAERAPVCGSDYFQHILYARTPGTADRLDTVRPQLQAVVRRMNAILNQDALTSGGVSADYKVLCGGDHQPRVDGFVSPSAGFDDVVQAARASGFNAPMADYTIFFDGGGGDCGVGSYIDDERLSASNHSNEGGGYAVIYRSCWFSETPMHENAHAQGAVQYGSPYSTGSGGHCWDENDVMCYSPDGGDLHQGGIINRCNDRIHFDCGNDDYFDASPEAGEYLAGHWNLGSPLNNFIDFGPPTANPPPTNPIGGLIGAVSGTVSSLLGGIGSASGRGVAGAPGNWAYFKTRVRSGTAALNVSLTGPASTDLDLYLRRGTKPTDLRYSCQSARDASTEACRARNPRAGAWFIGVHTAGGAPGAEFSLRSRQLRR